MKHDRPFDSFESRLAALRPEPPAVDRNRLMYQAGWAAAQARPVQPTAPSLALWKGATAASSLAAVCLLAVALRQGPSGPTPAAPPERQVAAKSAHAATPEAQARPGVSPPAVSDERFGGGDTMQPSLASQASYLALREAAVAGRLEMFESDRSLRDGGKWSPDADRTPPSTRQSLMLDMLADVNQS